MRKKEAILLIHRLKNLEKLNKDNFEKIEKLNANLETLNNVLKVLPQAIQTDQNIKQETNKKVDRLIEQVDYANRRLEN